MKEIIREFNRKYGIEYTTSICYFDFVANLFKYNEMCHKMLRNDNAQEIIRLFGNWIDKHYDLNESIKLFRHFSITVPRDNTQLKSVHDEAMILRVSLFGSMQEKSLKLKEKKEIIDINKGDSLYIKR